MAQLNINSIRDLFFELISIDSPSLHEREIAARVARKLVHLGFQVEEDDAGEAIGGTSGNLIATRHGNPNRKPILLTAHLDSVPPCTGIVPIEENGIVRSNGSTVLGADDKAGVTAVLTALESIANDVSCPTIQVVFTVAEELGLAGSKHVDRDRLIAKEGIALDSGGQPGTLIIAGPSQAKWEVEVFGRKAHAGVAPETGVSAIRIAAGAVARMPHGRLDKDTTVNIGSFVGEGPTNIVTDNARLIGEARSHDEERLDNVLEEIRSAFHASASAHGGNSKFSSMLAYHGFQFDSQHPLRHRVEQSMKSIGITPNPVRRGGGSDANIFTGLGIPTLNLGVGYENIHSTSECIRLNDIARAAEIVVAFCQTER